MKTNDGISLQTRFLMLFLGSVLTWIGCTSEFNLATQQEEVSFYDTQKEVEMGFHFAQSLEKHYPIVYDLDMNQRVESILARIVEVCDRKDLVYFIKVLEDDLSNAMSLPGGYIYIFKGLLEEVDNDDQLAGVIAHEVGHITARHAIKRLQSVYAAMLLQLASAQTNAQVASGVDMALTSLFFEYSQQDEYEADRLAVKYVKKTGYDPQAILDFLKKLKDEQQKSPPRQHSYWRSHPHLSKRMAVVHQEMTGQLEFKDYLNLTEP